MVTIAKDSIDQSVDVFIGDSSSTIGAGLAGLVFNTAGLKCYYRRGHTGTATELALVTLATIGTAHADGGFKEIDATNMKGAYRLDLSDAIVATGVDFATVYLYGATDMAPTVVRIELVASLNSNGGVIEANAVQISGDSGAADNLEADYDGAGYAKTNSSIGTATAVTDPVTVGTNNDKTGYALSAAGVTAAQSGLATAAGVSAVETDTQDIQGRLPAALTAGGKMPASVDEVKGTALGASKPYDTV